MPGRDTDLYWSKDFRPTGHPGISPAEGPNLAPAGPVDGGSVFRYAGSWQGPAPVIDPSHPAADSPAASWSASGVLQGLPPDFEPWWNRELAQAVRLSCELLAVDVDSLVFGALECSPQVRALKLEAAGLKTAICEENAAFDWSAFVESYWDDNSDPVGNLLTTGGAPRFRDHVWSATSGLRRKNRIGGELEISQKIGWQDNNSRYFVPRDQGTARLEIAYTQPLLSKAGRAYNESRIVLAQLDAAIGRDELRDLLQDHLLEVTDAYWDLYRARAIHLQKQKLLASASAILEHLEARQAVDAVRRQLLRAQAAVASRRSEIARARMLIGNAESELRLLVNDPQLAGGECLELIPRDAPAADSFEVSMQGSIQTALRNRPDIAWAIREMRVAGVRLGIAENELLPRLDLILSTYAAGLQGDSDIGQALADQFSTGEPGYSVGLTFELPLRRRAAKARLSRRQLQVQQALYEFRTAVETGKTEVEVAVRQVETAFQETLARFQAMTAAENEEHYLRQRWQHLPNFDGTTAQLLETLLDAQERLAEEEAAFVTAQVDYTLAMAYLKRAMGTLLRFTDDGPCQDGVDLGMAVPTEGTLVGTPSRSQ
jgi:outer membrane protein TolC